MAWDRLIACTAEAETEYDREQTKGTEKKASYRHSELLQSVPIIVSQTSERVAYGAFITPKNAQQSKARGMHHTK
jgi:hypothetical protein